MPQQFTNDIETKYSGLIRDANFVVSAYHADKSPALQIMSPEGEAVLTASVCMDIPPEEDCIIIKDWSENEGIEAVLIKAGLIEANNDPRLHASGFVLAGEFKMIGKLLEAWQKFKATELQYL